MKKEPKNIDLTAAQREEIARLLKQHIPNTEVWAYGSRVKFTARPSSDLDLVAFATPEQKQAVYDLKEAFEESDLSFRVDLFIWDEVPEQFHKNIEAERVVLQDRAAGDDIPEGWEEKILGDVIITNEATYSNKENWKFINYLDTGNITENQIFEIQHLVVGEEKIPSRAKRKVKIGDIVYSTVRPNQKHYGILRKLPKNLLVSTGFVTIRARKEFADTNFIYWFLTQPQIVEKLQTIGEHSTSAYPSVKPSDIEELKINLPPLSEQRAIAHILGSLDDKIELNRRMNETLEAMAQALFKSWFVDFDPVIDNALAAGNDIPEELKEKAAIRKALGDARKTLPEEIQKLFPAEFEHTEEMGWIPKGWKVVTVGDLIELVYGKALSAKIREPGSFPVYGSGGIVGYHKEALVDGPGIIVGRKGTVGSIFWEHGNFFPIDTVFFVKNLKNLPIYWLYQKLFLLDIASLGADSAVPGVNRNAVYVMKWTLPANGLLNAYWDLIKNNIDKTKVLNIQIELLLIIRNVFLPKLLSGEIKVSEFQKFM